MGYGRREVVSEMVAFDWGFTGHYYHAESGLHLAPFRAYSAVLGRWLSRDPLGEAGGINLYEYALSNPVNFVDPLGLSVGDFFAGFANSYTFGVSGLVLDALGVDGINKCSAAYAAGGWVGFGAKLLAGGTLVAGGIIVARALMKGGAKRLAGGASGRVASPISGRGSPIKPYSELRKVTRGKRGEIQAHHILEQRHLKNWGYSKTDIANAPSQVLTRGQHNPMTNALREALPYGRPYTRQEVWQAYQRVYANQPEYLRAISSYFR